VTIPSTGSVFIDDAPPQPTKAAQTTTRSPDELMTNRPMLVVILRKKMKTKLMVLRLLSPKTDIPKTDIPKTDIPKTDIPKTDIPKTDIPKTDITVGLCTRPLRTSPWHPRFLAMTDLRSPGGETDCWQSPARTTWGPPRRLSR
jgi:hypothetical protein